MLCKKVTTFSSEKLMKLVNTLFGQKVELLKV